MRREPEGKQKWYRLGMAERTWRRLAAVAGWHNTSVADIINRYLVERLDADGVPDPEEHELPRVAPPRLPAPEEEA